MNSVNIIVIKLIVNFILPEMKKMQNRIILFLFIVIICNQRDHMHEETHEFLEFTETIKTYCIIIINTLT